MAKRNVNDRNAIAIAKRQAENLDYYETEDGFKIPLQKPDLAFVQQAIYSVEMPDEPTYEVKIGSRTVQYPLDALVIKQTEDPLEKAKLRKAWMEYQTDLNNANLEQARRSTGSLFYTGTSVPDDWPDGWDDPKWRKKMKVTGWPIPADREESWVFYLQTSLSESDVVKMSSAIVRKAGGVSDEMIEAAEGMFSDELPTEQGSSDVEDAETDQG